MKRQHTAVSVVTTSPTVSPTITDVTGESEVDSIVVPQNQRVVLTRVNNNNTTRASVSEPDTTAHTPAIININVQQAQMGPPSTFGLDDNLMPSPPNKRRRVDEVLADHLLPPPVSRNSLDHFNIETYDSKDPWIQRNAHQREGINFCTVLNY